MPTYSGTVTLPDGRQFKAVSVYSPTEYDTGAANHISIEITDMEDKPLDADAFNEEIDDPKSPFGKSYLWEMVDELVCQNEPEWDDYDPLP